MNSNIDILHHVGLIATNMASNVSRYEQLGFAFTPLSLVTITLAPGTEPMALGAGNRCAIFERNYLELVGVVDQQRWDMITKAQRGPFDIDEPQKRYAGLHIMHLGTDDLMGVRERLIKQGTSCSEITRFQRNVETQEGEQMMSALSLHFPPGNNPEALIQIAQHLTPELVLQPRYMQHQNGAKAVTECIVCTTDPVGLAAMYERYSGHRSEQRDTFTMIELGYSRILIVTPESLSTIIPDCEPPALPFLAGFSVATKDLDVARTVLVKNQIAFREQGGRLIVGPEEACGSAVIFEREGAIR